MLRWPRFVVGFILVGVVFGPLAGGCGGGAATGDLDKIQVELTQFEVVVTNIAGRALFEVQAAIDPVGPASPFTATVPRMENGEKRTLSHTVFLDRDAVRFSPRNVKVKDVTVTGKDIDGKAYQVVVPWKQ